MSRAAWLALRAHLKQLDLQKKEGHDRDGYFHYPDAVDEPGAWDKVADWAADWSEARSRSKAFRVRTRRGQSSS